MQCLYTLQEFNGPINERTQGLDSLHSTLFVFLHTGFLNSFPFSKLVLQPSPPSSREAYSGSSRNSQVSGAKLNSQVSRSS